MRLPDLRFRHKMLLPPGVAILALLLTLLFTRWLGAKQHDILAAIEQRHLPMVELSRELEDLLSAMQRQLQDAAAAEDADGLAAVFETRNAFVGRVAEARERKLLSPREAEQLDEALRGYYTLARATTARLIEKVSGEEVTTGLTEMSERYKALRDSLAAGTAAARKAMADAFTEAEAIQVRSSRLVLLVMIVAAAAAAGLALALISAMDRGLAALTAVAKRVASEGDLSQQVEITSKDELGELAEAFGRMMERLRTLLAALKAASEDLSGAATILDTSTENQTQLLQQQASFLTEVSATTKELEQTSSLATQQAEAVLGIARDAGEYSRSGEASASESLARVQEIQQQIRNIVTRSAQLGEQARQVGDIVESVKEIASQSQILSLNASIEAARAGEAGRGFAVVAHEVRALAEQSGQSAGRIGKIVQDIVRAVGATVEMTEQGNRTMEAGIERIRASGESLKEIGSFIGTTSEAALQIAGAVKQQSAGVAQIATAISDLDARMQEAVRGIQAVRQAAGKLTSTSSSIRTVVSEFRA